MSAASEHREQVLWRDNGCLLDHTCDPRDHLDAAHFPISKQALKAKHHAAVIASDKRKLTAGRKRLARAELEDVLWDPRNSIGLCRAAHHSLDAGNLEIRVPKHAREFMAHFDLEPA